MHLVNTTHITLVAQTVESDQGEVKTSKHWQKKKRPKNLKSSLCQQAVLPAAQHGCGRQ